MPEMKHHICSRGKCDVKKERNTNLQSGKKVIKSQEPNDRKTQPKEKNQIRITVKAQ
jgi:hypothetical protein